MFAPIVAFYPWFTGSLLQDLLTCGCQPFLDLSSRRDIAKNKNAVTLRKGPGVRMRDGGGYPKPRQ
jgi:hypothetical protein